MQKKFIRNDFILIVCIFLIAAISFFVFKFTQKSGVYVTVSVDGKILSQYPLDKDFKEDVITNYGKNILVIKNGSAYVSEADCPDKICTAHRAISKTEESIVCLPHKLVLTIESE